MDKYTIPEVMAYEKHLAEARDNPFIDGDGTGEIIDAILSLPTGDKRYWLIYMMLDYSIQDLADYMNVKKTSTKVKISRIRREIKEKLK